MDNTNFAGMYLGNEIDLSPLFRSIAAAAKAIHTHLACLPTGSAFSELGMPFAA